MKFNINNIASVTLTEKGKVIYLSKRYTDRPLKGGKVLKTELWYIMNIFGEYVHMGADPVFENNIIDIEEE